jgi:hypothetical protein
VATYFLKGAGIGALLVGVTLSVFAAITYDPRNYVFGPHEIGQIAHPPDSMLEAAYNWLIYGGLVGAIIGGPIGAVLRAFFKT